MANMSYCKFRNTLYDLVECYEQMDDKELSLEEEKSRAKLVKLCKKIAEEYSDG